MNNKPLNASPFRYKTVFCNNEFEEILAGIIACYYCIVEEKILLPSNDENEIRNVMLSNYLKNAKFKTEHPPLGNYLFDKETVENNGRADIRILSMKPYVDDYSYYIIECKRLDNKNQTGKSGLNGEYVYEGIVRFLSKTYPFYRETAGMIGFVVVKMDIEQNNNAINQILQTFPESKTQQELMKKQILPGFDYSYYSSHLVEREIKYIYHLMLDFSENVERSGL